MKQDKATTRDHNEARFRGAADRPRTDGGFLAPRGPDIAPPGKDPTPDIDPNSAKVTSPGPEHDAALGGESGKERKD